MILATYWCLSSSNLSNARSSSKGWLGIRLSWVAKAASGLGVSKVGVEESAAVTCWVGYCLFAADYFSGCCWADASFVLATEPNCESPARLLFTLGKRSCDCWATACGWAVVLVAPLIDLICSVFSIPSIRSFSLVFSILLGSFR